MNEQTKEFDAVEMMREARDRISRDIKDMNFEEQRDYIRKRADRARKRLKSAEKTEAA